MKIKEVSIRVKDILINKPIARDNDNVLVAQIWINDIAKIWDVNMSALTFLELLANNHLTSFESIRRCRQLLQSCYPELRGSVYEARHKKATSVKAEISEEKFPMILDSKYTQITKEIYNTLKKGETVYYTHPDADDILNSRMNNDWAQRNCRIGHKYKIKMLNNNNQILGFAIYLTEKSYVWINPSQFSILKK